MSPTPFWSPYPDHRLVDFSEVDRSICSLFEACVAEFPDRIVLETEEARLSFFDLNAAANAVANGLLKQLSGEAERVCLWMPETMQQVCAVVGVWKAGKVLVSTDPQAPPVYNEHVIKQADPTVLITVAEFMDVARQHVTKSCKVILYEDLARGMDRGNPGCYPNPSHPCTLIFTSGSTGVPKAVVLSQSYMVFQSIVYANSNGLRHEDVRLFLSPLTHVNGPLKICSAIVCGVAISYYPLKRYGVSRLAAWIRDKRITSYSSVPTVFRYFLKTAGDDLDLSTVRFVHLGGETVRRDDVELFKRYFPDDCILCVNIGSSEAGSISRYYINKDTRFDGDEVPLGMPYPYKELLIVDASGETLSPGEVGEIVVKSPYLADGYFRQADETAKYFSACPEDPGQRLYRTGDLGRIRKDGCLIYLGRQDHQVKVNGHRIELGEIESCLAENPEVKLCAVKAWTEEQGGVNLVAYAQVDSGSSVDEHSLRAWLAERLVYYKIPRQFVVVDKLPLLDSGKLDRKALAEPVKEAREADQLMNPVEKAIFERWCEVFNRKDLGLDDNFFALGGDSLKMISLAQSLSEFFGREIPQNVFFTHPSIREQASWVETADSMRSNIVPLCPGGSGRPLYIVHGWAGTVFHWMQMASMLDLDRPIYGIQGNEFCGAAEKHASVEAMAEDYARQIMDRGTDEPVDLAGYSLGGIFAFALASKLQDMGCSTGCIYIVDTQPRNLPKGVHYQMIAPYMLKRLGAHLVSLMRRPSNWNMSFIRERWEAFSGKVKTRDKAGMPLNEIPISIDPDGDYYVEISKQYLPRPRKLKVSLIKFRKTGSNIECAWKYLSKNPVEISFVEGDHMDLLKPGFQKEFVPVFRRAILARRWD